ncbi:hypothetical protein [Paracoccus sp. 22332]|uniref:hypothetical protein n=1 Tax=Paracoccus sp. 22332 TaxID=3453913 RepID=UPI003F82DF12
MTDQPTTPAQVAVKPLLKRDTATNLGWTLDFELLESLRNEAGDYGRLTTLEAVEAVALAVEARIRSALIPAPSPEEQEPVATAARRILELYDDAMHDLLDPGAHGSHPDSDEMAELRRIVGAQPHQWSPAHPAPVPAVLDDVARLVAELRADAEMHQDLLPDRAADALEAQAAELARLRKELARVNEALEWYGDQARLARLIHSGGDAGRHALQEDGGTRARAAFARNDALRAALAQPADGSHGEEG